ncbi:MAG: carboxypeptidase-like regulatory domain-containing protein [Saprospiraceae bacterium]|nr:carboxypeptidase-like regulatory domain-containing protein [Saprospiraceae bacterium]
MKYFSVIFLFFMTINLCAQKAIDKKIDATYTNKSITEIFYDLENTHNIKVYFDIQNTPTFRVTRNYKQKQIWSIVSDLLNGTRLKSLSYDDDEIVVIDIDKVTREKIENLVLLWKNGEMDYPKREETIEISRSYGNSEMNGTSLSYQIQLRDKLTKEPMIGALVYTEDLKLNDVTDENGLCTIQLTPGSYVFSIKYTSYQTILLSIDIFESATEKLEMNPSIYLLDEVEIVANNASIKIEDSKTGVERIDMVKVESIPQALGESDLIKSLEILPGVTSAGEISSGFNVRGGKLDASLVLIDDAIIFNPTHVVGFISAFNSDVVKSATLYKGFVEPEFGNRSSAVLDIVSKKGGQKWIMKGGLGTSMMKLFVEGPLSNKTTFAASARGSFSDYLLNLVANNEVQNSSANFYDANFTLQHKFSDRTTFSFSSYLSDDYFLYNEDFGFEWQNRFVSFGLNHLWNEKFSSKINVSTGSYKTNQFTINASDAFSYKNGIQYLKVVQNNTFSFGDNSYIKGGIEFIDYKLDPEDLTPNEDLSVIQNVSAQRLSSVSIAPFIGAKVGITSKWSIEGGVRLTTYGSKGPGTIYTYQNDIATESTIIDSRQVENGERLHTFSLIEPRVSLAYLLNSQWSVKSSFNRISQNAQLVSIANTSIPTDLWIFSNEYILPRIVDQYSLGIFHNSFKRNFSFSIEGFRKTTANDFVLKDFPSIISNENLETEVSESIGRSYGVEFFAEKTSGKLKGSIAYTFSKTRFRTTTDRFPVNFGNWTSSDIDIPHQINLVFSYRLTPTFIFSGGYSYKSGRPFTVPEGTAIIDGFVIPQYSQRNAQRLPSYKRFDLAITLDLRKNSQSGFRNSFTFGLYNLLGNNNVNNVFFRKSVGGNIKGFQLAIIGAVVPSLSWNFVFD